MNIEISKVGGVMPLVRVLSPDNFLRKADDTDLAISAVHFAARVVLNVAGTGKNHVRENSIYLCLHY